MTKKQLPFVPFGDRVVVTREKSPEKTPGGILIPDMAKIERVEAHVVAVGPGPLVDGRRVKLEVSTGDRVLLSKWVGVEIELDGEKHLVVRADDILGRFTK